MTRVKICGLTNLADARFSAAAGADYLGFIQHVASPRYIRPQDAREIIDWIHGPETVGVFQDAAADTVLESIATAGFSMVQLHGDETPDFCSRMPVPVIKTLGISTHTSVSDLEAVLGAYRGVVSHLLFDTRVADLRGGTGVAFDWRLVVDVARELPVFLAGGLRPDNVERAVSLVRPFAVDIASGVEESPGQKDYTRISALFQAMERFRDHDD